MLPPHTGTEEMRGLTSIRQPTPMNDDCWLEVFNLLAADENITSIWRLMRVCWSLYIAGMPILVRLWSNALSSECLYDPACVERFCLFMLSGDSMRLKQLRRLDVADIVGAPMWDQQLLFRVISGAVHLEELEVDGDTLSSYMTDPEATRHFARLTVLTVRSCNDVGEALQSLQAPVRQLTLDFDAVDDELEEEDEELPDVSMMILPFCDTLEVLSINNGWLDRAEETPSYPQLTCLQMENTFIPPVGQLARAFPNLRRLEAMLCYADEEGDEFRQLNERSQAQGNYWQHLDFISVHRPGFLYGLALSSIARSVAFELVDGPEETEVAAALLVTMQPSCLRIGTRSVSALQNILSPVLASLTNVVSRLHIIVDMVQEDEGASALSVDIAIVRILRHIGLLCAKPS